MYLVLASAAAVAGAYVSALLIGAGLLSLAARACRQLRERAGRRGAPAVGGQLDADPRGAAVKDTVSSGGPEFASGTEVLADLIVLRHTAEIPFELRARVVEGHWWNLAPHRFTMLRCPLADGSVAVATPSGRFEVDGAGRVAEVWELASPVWEDE